MSQGRLRVAGVDAEGFWSGGNWIAPEADIEVRGLSRGLKRRGCPNVDEHYIQILAGQLEISEPIRMLIIVLPSISERRVMVGRDG